MHSNPNQDQEISENNFVGHSKTQIGQAGVWLIQLMFAPNVDFHYLRRCALAMHIFCGAFISLFRGYPFPYLKSFEAIFLFLFKDKTEIRNWFRNFIRDLDNLYESADGDTENGHLRLNRVASELWLIPAFMAEIMDSLRSRNEHLASEISDLLLNFQETRLRVVNELGRYSSELKKKQENLLNIQSSIQLRHFNLSKPGRDCITLFNQTKDWIASVENGRINSPESLGKALTEWRWRVENQNINIYLLEVVTNFSRLLEWTFATSQVILEHKVRILIASFPEIDPGDDSDGSVGNTGDLFELLRSIFSSTVSLKKTSNALHENVDRLNAEVDELKERLQKARLYQNQREQKLSELAENLRRFAAENPDSYEQGKLRNYLEEAYQCIEKLQGQVEIFRNKADSLENENQTLSLLLKERPNIEEFERLKQENEELKHQVNNPQVQYFDLGFEPQALTKPDSSPPLRHSNPPKQDPKPDINFGTPSTRGYSA
ncbi:coiled-coil domain-containing protein [Nodosilinea sp. PGN35]|uniref:coiled-coil domain-containing protein n=1 Tax=Nodosilinea sp. PGN35 TaxID=3020489 RepID=UPI0023B2B176|nr:hypothetical protein [Nodosilinea sp. TSF1-S3]MDF0368555.1 hypothetical protein [Nodosilinea sp. TSF1-S3]